jgi:hypothetical protein
MNVASVDLMAEPAGAISRALELAGQLSELIDAGGEVGSVATAAITLSTGTGSSRSLKMTFP